MSNPPTTVDVLLPYALEGCYSYSVPPHLEVAAGDFVHVPLGTRQTIGVARDFMGAFNRNWLSQAGRSDPARALRETRLSYLNNPNPTMHDPRVWAPYVLVE